jgi:hypothetical protein
MEDFAKAKDLKDANVRIVAVVMDEEYYKDYEVITDSMFLDTLIVELNGRYYKIKGNEEEMLEIEEIQEHTAYDYRY